MPPWAATVCDLVGKSFEMQAVLKPASDRPKAAYKHQLVSKICSVTGICTYSESGATCTDDDGVVSVIDDGIVSNTALALHKMDDIS